jgi:hypothetical protein
MGNSGCSEKTRVKDLGLVLLAPSLIANANSCKVNDCIHSAKGLEIYKSCLGIPLHLIGRDRCATYKTLNGMSL